MFLLVPVSVVLSLLSVGKGKEGRGGKKGKGWKVSSEINLWSRRCLATSVVIVVEGQNVSSPK